MTDIRTPQDYAKYQQAVSSFRGRYQHISTESEEFFSWHGCNCCGSQIGQNYVQAQGVSRETEQVEDFRVCVDCEYYLEYERLDDATMSRLAQSAGEQAESAPDWEHSAQFMTEFDPSKAGPGLGE